MLVLKSKREGVSKQLWVLYLIVTEKDRVILKFSKFKEGIYISM
jgi:hypothetical protein